MGTTGIDKRSVIGPVTFAKDEVMNDVIVDREHHGGYDQAVYAYAREDADWWEKQLGIIIENGRFGENLTVFGFDINAAVIGERWQIGSVVLEVSQPTLQRRTPRPQRSDGRSRSGSAASGDHCGCARNQTQSFALPRRHEPDGSRQTMGL